MHFTCFNQKYSEFNCGHLGIKLKSLGAFWKKFAFVKLGNGRGQNWVWPSEKN